MLTRHRLLHVWQAIFKHLGVGDPVEGDSCQQLQLGEAVSNLVKKSAVRFGFPFALGSVQGYTVVDKMWMCREGCRWWLAIACLVAHRIA